MSIQPRSFDGLLGNTVLGPPLVCLHRYLIAYMKFSSRYVELKALVVLGERRQVEDIPLGKSI